MSYSSRSSDPIQELFANLHSILPIALALAAWAAATWSKLKKKQAAAAPPAVDEAERTRRVQEEVRRKIADRRRSIPSLDPFGGPSRGIVKPSPAPERIPAGGLDDPAVLERQRWLAAQARDLRPAAPLPAFGTALDAQPPVVSPWLAELRDPSGVRRAVVLREILGTPVGLR